MSAAGAGRCSSLGSLRSGPPPTPYGGDRLAGSAGGAHDLDRPRSAGARWRAAASPARAVAEDAARGSTGAGRNLALVAADETLRKGPPGTGGAGVRAQHAAVKEPARVFGSSRSRPKPPRPGGLSWTHPVCNGRARHANRDDRTGPSATTFMAWAANLPKDSPAIA